MSARETPPIALIGLMGAGKSEVARRLASRLNGPALDLDARLETESGASVSEWFERHGEASFRSRERELLERSLEDGPAVIACGGGIVLDPAARSTLALRCRTVWLVVSPAEAARRLTGQERTRPLLAGANAEDRLAALLAEREVLYRAAARFRVMTDGLSADQVADAVLAVLASPAGP